MTSSLTGSRGPTGTNPGRNATGKMFNDKVPSGYKAGYLQQYGPEAMDLYQQLFGYLGPDSFLAKLAGGDEGAFAEMEEPALRQFQQLQGGLASRFSGAAGGGSQRSLSSQRGSGFRNTMTQASADFAKDLQGQRQQLQRQALQDLFGISHQLLNEKPFQRIFGPKQESQGFDWGGLAGAGIGAAGGFFAGGPMGALTGASIGHGIGSGRGSSTQFSSSPNWDYNQYLPIFGNV